MSGSGEVNLLSLYEKFLKKYGKQNWWPVDYEYHKRQGSDPREEVVIGAILTQNTAWKNVEKALENLKREKLLSFEGIRKIEKEKLENLIKPAGFYKRKAEYLKNFVKRFKSIDELSKASRSELLKLKGIGRETADAILLYATDRLTFVVDAYTKRLLKRLRNVEGSYEEIKALFERNLPKKLELYKEFHALIDVHAKEMCRKRPLCERCILKNECLFYLVEAAGIEPASEDGGHIRGSTGLARV